MSLYTAAEIKAEILRLNGKIAKAEDQQITTGGGPGQGQHTQRGDLGAMYRERKRLEDLYAQVAAQEQGAGSTSLVQFEGMS